MMEKLPALQFYTADWRKDPCVQALDHEHKGVWIDLLCIMNETSRRGFLVLPSGDPMPDEAIARNLGLEPERWTRIRRALVSLGVASESDDGALYNRRMVRDEKTRRARARAGKKGGAVSGFSRRKSRRERELNGAPPEERLLQGASSGNGAEHHSHAQKIFREQDAIGSRGPRPTGRVRSPAPRTTRTDTHLDLEANAKQTRSKPRSKIEAKRGSSVAVAVAVAPAVQAGALHPHASSSPPVAGGREGESPGVEPLNPDLRARDREIILRVWHLGRETVSIDGKRVGMGLEMRIRDELAALYGAETLAMALPHVRAVEEFPPDQPISLRLPEKRPEVMQRMVGHALKLQHPAPGRRGGDPAPVGALAAALVGGSEPSPDVRDPPPRDPEARRARNRRQLEVLRAAAKKP